MRIAMEFRGIEELVKAFEKAAGDDEIKEVNKRIVQKSIPVVKKIMSEKVPESIDHSKSGKWYNGYRHVPSERAAESVPVGQIRINRTGASADVGWDESDTSEHFYVKFVNWGTIYQPPKEFIYATKRVAETKLQVIAEQEYEGFLNNTIGTAR